MSGNRKCKAVTCKVRVPANEQFCEDHNSTQLEDDLKFNDNGLLTKMRDALDTGTKYDGGKPDLSLLPKAGLEAAARAFMYGASKYSRNNYKKGMDWSRLVAAALRHLTAWNDGEVMDQESGLNHLDHALACLHMLAFYQEYNVGIDDRYQAVHNPKVD